MNDIKLTEYFNLREFECPCCHRVRLCPLLLWRLGKLRGLWAAPLVLTSAFRCDAHNSAVGGVKNSLHRLGQAADVRVRGQAQGQFTPLARECGFAEVIPYPERGFVHIGVAFV